MKKLCLIIVLAHSLAFASSQSYFIIAYKGVKSTAVSLIKQADYLSMPLTVKSNQRDSAERFAEIRQAQNLIVAKAKENSELIVHRGPISISLKPLSKMSLYSSYSHNRPTEAQFYILAKLKKEEDVYACADRIRKFIDSITMPGKSYHSIGQIELAVDNPEQYRPELLEKISQNIAFLKKTLKTNGNALVRGLERPVLVHQMDDKNVELFIDYELTIDMSKQGLQ